MTTSNTTIEEGSCTIVIFFLLLPVMICIIKDVKRDFMSFINPTSKANKSGFELDADLVDPTSTEYERESLLSNDKSKDSDEESNSNMILNNNHNNHNRLNHRINNQTHPMTVTLVDSKRNILAQTTSPHLSPQNRDSDDDDDNDSFSEQLCTNSKIPELILNNVNNVMLSSEYNQYLSIEIKPMELILWLLFLTLSYIALRTMVVTKNMRYNFKYNAVEMQDIFELCLRGIIMYIFGNIAQRVRVGFKFFLWIGWFVFFYPFVFQICPTSFTIDTEVTMDWTLISICIFVGVSNVYIVLDNFYYVYKIKKWWIYGYGAFGTTVLYHIIFIKSANSDIDIHIHHHHWAFILSLFLHSTKDSSIVMHALLTAVFIHGITVFGCENLFDYKDLQQTDVIDV